MEQELLDAGLHDTFHTHVMRLQPELVEMTINGVSSDDATQDPTSADELGRSLEAANAVCQSKARVATGRPDFSFNPRSPTQLANSSFKELRLGRTRN